MHCKSAGSLARGDIGQVRERASLDGQESGSEGPPQGLFLLFEEGRRPDRGQLLSAIADIPSASVSHDPSLKGEPEGESAANSDPAHSGDWLELLQWGITFDLLGMGPGPSVAVPEIAYRFGCDVDAGAEGAEAIAIVPGPHIADGAHSLPIVRAMLDLGSGLAQGLEGVLAVCWSPARSAMGVGVFSRSVEGWLAGGAFPSLGLAGFAMQDDGTMASEGLAHFTGQELLLDGRLAADPVAATRLGARIIHELVASGRLEEPREFETTDGALVKLLPAASGETIEVSPM